MSKPQADHVLILGDTHLPYADIDALIKVIAYAQQVQPTHIVQIGDLFDNYSFSRFYKSLEQGDPAIELKTGRDMAETLWGSLQKAAPQAKCFQLSGNHDGERLRKLVLQAKPELYSIVEEFQQARMTFKGVKTVRNYHEHLTLKINGKQTVFTHGFLSNTAKHLYFYKCDVVLGHLHRAEIQYAREFGGITNWAMNVGYLGDEKSPVFDYTMSVKKNWTPSFGVIDALGPRVVAL